MASNQTALTQNKKVFFITSSYSKGSDKLEYSLQKSKALKNLKAGLQGEYLTNKMHSNDKYTISVCSFEIVESEINDLKDKDTKTYTAKIILKNEKNYKFEGLITFRYNNKNLFIYDFKFNEYKNFLKKTPPPASIPFTKNETFGIYMEFLKTLKNLKELKEELFIHLIEESRNLIIFKENFQLDFFMSIFKACYSRKEIILLLLGYKLEKTLLPDNFNYKSYSSMLDMIDKKPVIIIQHCIKQDPNKIYIKFYTLLFYFRRIFEKDKAEKMIQNTDLYQYFADFLPKYPSFFKNLICGEELIKQMFEKYSENLNMDLIKGILSYAGSIENVLNIINKNITNIKNCAYNVKKKIIVSKIVKPNESDNLKNIKDEIDKIIKFEAVDKVSFISFDEDLWKSYIDLNNDLKNLELIYNSIKLCATFENELSAEKLGLIKKIHETGIKLIESEKLKNEELLNFIGIDSYFSDRNKEKKIYRPYQIILKGLDFDTMTDNFFENWKNSNIFAIFNFEIHNFKNELINKLNDAKDLGKILKLFDYQDKNIFDYSTRNILRAKFKCIAPSYKLETCPNFIQDVAYYIYIIDYIDNKNIQDFLKNTIETFISSLDMKRDIYLYLTSNYKNISNNAIECITNSLLSNKSI